jgi:hypothetical protein
MSWEIIDKIVFAPLAPIFGVILFWSIQLLLIESMKHLLRKIWVKHESLCRFTNLVGLFFQAISHAIGYTITKCGVSHFYVSVDESKVEPKKPARGIIEWVTKAFLFVGPFFIPAFLIFILLFFGYNIAFSFPSTAYSSFSDGLVMFGSKLAYFSNKFFELLINLDLINPFHLFFLLFVIFIGLGIRPLYIGKEKERRKINIIYDLQNIRELLAEKPLYVLAVIAFFYILFHISLFFNLNWYILLLLFFGWLSIISIISIVIAHLIILLVKNTDEIMPLWNLLPYVTMFASYGFSRLFFLFYSSPYQLSVSLLIMIMSVVVVTLLLKKFKTNKLKTLSNIKNDKKLEADNIGNRR